jgi:hypothetical protein
MNRVVRTALAVATVTGLSCARSSTPATTPAPSGTGAAAAPARPAPAVAPAPPAPPAPPAAGGRGGPPDGPPGGPPGGVRPRRVPLTPEQRAARRDSMAVVRKAVVDSLMAQIAGREDSSSQVVFQNLELMQDTTAGHLVKLMDEYSVAMGRNCEFCHLPGKWADDSKENKKRARVMIQITNAINREQLTKMPADREGTPKISCITCHRGSNSPNRQIVP